MKFSRNAIQPGIPIMSVNVCFPLFILSLIFNSAALAQTADLRVHAIAINPYEEPSEASNRAHGNLSSVLNTLQVFAGSGGSFSEAIAVVNPDFTISGFATGVAAGYAEFFGANGSVSIHAELADFIQESDDGSQNILLSPVKLSSGGEGSPSARYSFEFFETNSHKMIAQGSFSEENGVFSFGGAFVEEDFTVGPNQDILLSDPTIPIDVSQITPGADLTLTHSWTVSGNTFSGSDSIASVTIIPEPSTWILFGLGLLAVFYRSRPLMQQYS